ncbi:MAG: addiction module toxin RelE [Gammaproteobacteria bacterium]|nr:MAG: addiction module toxin RelE [Gammaproteobacteria bacterium]
MASPLRLEYAGAIYHVTSRGDRREDIYLDEDNRAAWLDVLGTVCHRFNWVIHGYCQMTNHYHLLVETVDGNLSRGMRQLNGIYTQRFNRTHQISGHLFQGRYKAILVQREAYLLELSRYIVLNPVRAGMVELPEQWPWSSYLAMAVLSPAPEWIDQDWLLGQFGALRKTAINAYKRFVLEGRGVDSPLALTQHQLLLGDEAFVARHHQQDQPQVLRELSKAHRRTLAKPLGEYQTQIIDRDQAMAQAYLSGAYTMAEIGEHFGVHYMTVSRAVKRHGQP